MGQETKIQWCDHTFNPWRGCTKISPGCANCYADAQAKRNPGMLGIWGDNGSRVVASEAKWKEPPKWDREARKAGERRRVFCASMADVFEDWEGHLVDSRGERAGLDMANLGRVRRRLIRVMWDTPHLDWLLLTKRIENAERMLYEMGFPDAEWPKNYWLGTTVENQEQADKRIPILLNTPAPIRWLSMEPLLGPVDLSLDGLWETHCRSCSGGYRDPETNAVECVRCEGSGFSGESGIDWVIVGGESGPKARHCDLDWIRSIRDQCIGNGVPVFVKQLGSVWARENKAGDNHGGDPEEWPEDLRVREFPVSEPA